ncbi:YebG family protein [Teredinibacter haidensis]|uniref:YebG family protein n=1 Tax=Teredinibacter haidensis TaxID=2731755 RepID=UPI0009490E37|nr:YebG family protein [Teredinibacter haidensis]
MAVIAVWKCDRDGSMFDDKKAADAHDKMLELAASITSLIEAEVPGVSEQDVEAIGLLLAKRSDDLVKACKGKPSVLLTTKEAEPSSQEENKITAITG